MLIPTVKRKSRRLPPRDVNQPTGGGDETGLIYAELELTNSDDLAVYHRGLLPGEEIRSIRVRALVDSGAYQMVINEHIKGQLGLRVIEERVVALADESERRVDVVGPVEIRFKNRMTLTTAIVLPGTRDVLLGSIPMEDLDVVIDPKRQTLEVNPANPNIAVTIVKNVGSGTHVRVNA
ncbi:MAG TPA: clan AA aspartic protease [Pyrinomonadaceae bacterium]|nr:clan AA aspartic protease [Pyrinomonadaceae bacterium]